MVSTPARRPRLTVEIKTRTSNTENRRWVVRWDDQRVFTNDICLRRTLHQWLLLSSPRTTRSHRRSLRTNLCQQVNRSASHQHCSLLGEEFGSKETLTLQLRLAQITQSADTNKDPQRKAKITQIMEITGESLETSLF